MIGCWRFHHILTATLLQSGGKAEKMIKTMGIIKVIIIIYNYFAGKLQNLYFTEGSRDQFGY